MLSARSFLFLIPFIISNMNEALENFQKQIASARTEIKNLRQQLATIKHEHLKEMKAIRSSLNGLRCASCASAEATTLNHILPSTSVTQTNDQTIEYKPIGYIETMFYNKRGVPRQPTQMANCKGSVVVDTNVFSNPEHALDGLAEFSHMWIIFHFHVRESTSVPAKVAPPRLGGARRGVFATRAPLRPCPIGLSLVRIEAIEGNKIHFLGVDMVNGTPVLDIKPYIPQYDYPALESSLSMAARDRPPTEGISDVTDGAADLMIDDTVDGRSSPPGQPIAMAGLPSPGPLSPSPTSPRSPPTSERAAGRDAERGAPDGQERFTPPQIARLPPQDGIRVAPWITNTVTQTYEVRFTDDVTTRLEDLIGDRAQSFKDNIQVLLSEDPRSNYVKTRYPDHEYSCVLEDLSISCVFDAAASVCKIVAVRSADDM